MSVITTRNKALHRRPRRKQPRNLPAADQCSAMPRRGYVSPFYIALIYAGLENKERALDYLQKACEDRFEWIVHINVDPVWDFLRADPGFRELLKRIGLH